MRHKTHLPAKIFQIEFNLKILQIHQLGSVIILSTEAVNTGQRVLAASLTILRFAVIMLGLGISEEAAEKVKGASSTTQNYAGKQWESMNATGETVISCIPTG